MLKYKNIPNFILFPLLIWFIVSFVHVLIDPIGNLPVFFFSEINVVFGVLFSIIINYYVSNEVKFYMYHINLQERSSKIISYLVDITFFVTVLLILISIFRLYLSKFVVL